MATQAGGSRAASPAHHVATENSSAHHQEPTTIVIDSGGSSSNRLPLHPQHMVKSLQAALQKKTEECAFWRDLYTNLVSQKEGVVEHGFHNGSTNGQKNGSSSGGKDPKRALEEATGYFAVEMANKRLKTEQQATLMKEKMGKVLEQLSRQQQMCKEKDQQMVLREKQYEMDLARRDHELQMSKLEKDHAVELAHLQVKLRYLERDATVGEASVPLVASPTRRSGSMEIQESKLARLQSDLQRDIKTVRDELEGKLSRLADQQDSKVAGLKTDHEEKISRLRLDLEARILASAGSSGSSTTQASTTTGVGRTSSVSPDKPTQRQVFDCQGDCDNSKLFTANCPLMKTGLHKWTMRIKRRNGSPRLGVISSVCTQLDSGKWLGESGIGWGYSDWGQTWHEGRHIKTDLPRFDEGDKVTFTLDLTGSGTLSASVNDDAAYLLFFDMTAKLNGHANAGFRPAATLLNSIVEFSDFESY